MEKWKKPLREWFGYNRRERVATMVLMVIISIMVMVRYLLPERSAAIEITAFSNGKTVSDTVANDPLNEEIVSGLKPVEKRVTGRTVINLNQCDSSDLVLLPGIGPVLSSRIIRYGNLLGGYADIGQLNEVYGLRVDVVERISVMVRADTTLLRKLRVNTDNYAVLLRHPYLDRDHVNAIVRYREMYGKISDWSVMVSNGMVPAGKEEYLRYYILY